MSVLLLWLIIFLCCFVWGLGVVCVCVWGGKGGGRRGGEETETLTSLLILP